MATLTDGRATLPTLAVVGNAPFEGDVAGAVDACTVVVRLNTAFGFGGSTGKRVDELVLINCGGQMEEWLRLGTIETTAAFRAATMITFPIHPDKADRIVPPLREDERAAAAAQDYSAAAAARYAGLGKAVRTYPADDFVAAMADLGHAPLRRAAPAPSTGYLVARWWLAFHPFHVHAFGFGFEGWDGHDWAAERRWFEAAAASGRLTLHPTGAAGRRRAA